MKQIKKLSALVLAVLLSVLVFAGCGSNSNGSTGGYPVTIGEVTVGSQPSGVAVLSDSLADVVLALGYEVQLKGKSESCTQDELSILPNVNIDDPAGIRATGADVVLLDTEPSPEQRSALEQEGLQVIVLGPATNRESLTTLYTEVGMLFQGNGTGSDRGQKVSNSTLLTLDDIYRAIPERDALPTACYLYDLDSRAATGDTFEGMLFTYVGLINIFDSGVNNSTEGASITAGNPQYIFCDVGLKEQIRNDSRFQNISAVKNNRVYEIAADRLHRQGGTILLVATDMAGYAYPELLQDASTDKNLSNILDDVPTSSVSETSSKTVSKAN